jgi:hypothetical protein
VYGSKKTKAGRSNSIPPGWAALLSCRYPARI